MSTQTRRRGARAETPEEPDTDEQTEEEESEEGEPAAPPEPPADPAEVQARRIDNARRKYHADLRRIVGDLEGTAECPVCDGLGLVPSGDDLVHRPDTERCPDCKGLGQMVTGSLVPNFTQLPCATCGGNGYTRKAPENVHQLPSVPPPPPAAPATQVHGWFDPVTQTFHPYAQAGES